MYNKRGDTAAEALEYENDAIEINHARRVSRGGGNNNVNGGCIERERLGQVVQ